MRRLAFLLIPCLFLAAGAGSRVRADEKPDEKPFVFPTMEKAQRVQQRHLKLSMQGNPIGGVSGRMGYLADGRMLSETRMQMQVQRENGGQVDVFRTSTVELELLAADGRLLASRDESTEAGVVETSDAVFAEKHVDVTHTGPGGTYRKRFDLPADHMSSYQVQQKLLAEWKEGTEPKLVHSSLDAKDQRFKQVTTTLLGKATYKHDGVSYPAWRIHEVDDEKQTVDALVGEDFIPFEVSIMGGLLKAVWVNEPTLEVEGAGWSMSSYVDVDRAVPQMLLLESLELNLVMDPPQAESDPTLIASGPYQDAARDATGYRLTLKAQRVPPGAEKLALPMKVEDPAVARFLAATPQAQSDHADVVALAKQLAQGAESAPALVRRIVGWVWAHVEKETGARGSATALEVLKACKGDCTEHAVLVVALCRAAGIPARAMGGIVYVTMKDKGGADKPIAGFHAWAEVWLGAWVPVDATIPEIGTSARYVYLSTDEPGETSSGAQLAQLVTRKVRLQVRAWKHEGRARVEAPKEAAKPAEAPAPGGAR